MAVQRIAVQRIAVTGATGFIARNIRRHLSGLGAELFSISRGNFAALKNETKIVTESYDPRIILPKIRHCDSIIHLVGIGKESIDHDYTSVNYTLTKNMLNMCKRAGIGKMVYLSGLGVSRSSTTGYFISKYRAERAIIESNLDYTIFRPSYIVGGGDPLTRQLWSQAKRGAVLIPGSGRFQIQPVYIKDVSRIISESLKNRKFSRGIFDLVGPELLTFGDYVRKFSRKTGTPTKKIPLETAYHDAVTGQTGFLPDDLNLLAGSFCGNPGKLARAYGKQFHRVTELFQSGVLS